MASTHDDFVPWDHVLGYHRTTTIYNKIDECLYIGMYILLLILSGLNEKHYIILSFLVINKP